MKSQHKVPFKSKENFYLMHKPFIYLFYISSFIFISGCSNSKDICFAASDSLYRDDRTGETLRIKWPGRGAAHITYGGLGVKLSDTRPNDGEESAVEVESTDEFLNYGDLISIPVRSYSNRWSAGSLDCHSVPISSSKIILNISCINRMSKAQMQVEYSTENGVHKWVGPGKGVTKGFSLSIVSGNGFGKVARCI